MSKQHRIGKYGTVFATRAELSKEDKDSRYSKVAAVLYLDTREPGPDYDKYPGLRINGIEYHYSATAVLERFETGAERVSLRHSYMRRAGGGADATDNARSVVYAHAQGLAINLFADAQWMAEGDVELAQARYDKAKDVVEEAEAALFSAKNAMVNAYLAVGLAQERLARMREGGDPETC